MTTKKRKLLTATQKAKNKKTKKSKEAFLKALELSLGIISTASEKANVGRSTVYYWLDNDEAFKNKVDSIEELALDFAESKLFELIQGKQFQQTFTKKARVGEKNEVETVLTTNKNMLIMPSAPAVIFFLKTKGKGRGYIEKIDIDLNALLDIQVGLPDEMTE